ncbi:DoxX family protein [Poritiphilus flavus]|uniref:DoxX family protein n=1 Tax=Poritiphilus flavus TaxID=2697053 RepID=A0A6L9ECG7_9FLAO|nr:DoxX family protein [Poritiphilus flavus]NAS12444.1 DoxX family protein [Poritiphilus flavus]
MKTQKIVYWIATSLFSAIMLFSVYNYFFNHEAIKGYFEAFGYPTYLVYPLAIAKILGLIAIWGNFSKWLREWAYAGFFFNTLLAFFAHYMFNGADYLFSLLALAGVLLSYFTGRAVRP